MTKIFVLIFAVTALATHALAADDMGKMPMLKISNLVTGFMPDDDQIWFKALLIDVPNRKDLGLLIAVGHPKTGFQQSLKNGDLNLPKNTSDGLTYTDMSIDHENSELQIETSTKNEFGTEESRRILKIGFFEQKWFVNAVKIKNHNRGGSGKDETCDYDFVDKMGTLNGESHPPTKGPVELATLKDSAESLSCEGW